MKMKGLLQVFNPAVSQRIFKSTLLPTTLRKKAPRIAKPNIMFSKVQRNEIVTKLSQSKIFPFSESYYYSQLQQFFKVQNNVKIHYCFVVDPEVAADIVHKIMSMMDQKNSTILELFPGIGLLTYNLLKSEYQNRIYVFENKFYMTSSLEKLKSKHGWKIKIIMPEIFKKGYLFHNPTILNLLSQSNTNYKIIGVIPNYSFFGKLIYLVVNNNLWDLISNLEFYVVISLNAYNKLIHFKHLEAKFLVYCMFNYLFETEVVAEYPRTAFLPYSAEPNDKMMLMKMKRKTETSISTENLPSYIVLLKIIGNRPHNFIIPTLDNWIPGSGPFLISKGISMTTKILDLTAAESVDLFNALTTFEGFKSFQLLAQGFDLENDR